MKALYLAYQDQNNRQWAPVARVTRENGRYRLIYTRGARQVKNFAGLGAMTKLEQEYLSDQIFPVLANRVLPRNRPEYREYLEWLGLSDEHDALEELARTGGLRATDSIELIPCPEPKDGKYEVYFFSRGLSHFTAENIARVNTLREGEVLKIMKDIQNDSDSKAALLRTEDPISLVGYVPRYYADDFDSLTRNGASQAARVTVERVNPKAPMQYRLLCRMTAPWSSSFEACSSEAFQPISGAEK